MRDWFSALLTLLLLLASAPAASQARNASAALQASPSDAALASFVEGYVANAVDLGGIPGAAVVLIRDGRVILARGFGWADYARGRPVDVEGTLFRQGSISKTFTWLMALQLVEEGKLDLDHNVDDYLEFPVSRRMGGVVTMRHLMTHSAGFADRIHGIFDPGPMEPLGHRLGRNVPHALSAPGTVVAYSNYGAALAAHILERLTGRPFDALAHERIFTRTGMSSATFAQPLPAPALARLASVYAPGSRRARPFAIVGAPPAGAASITPADMGRFLAMLMANGAGERGIVVKPETLASAWHLQRPLEPGLDSGFGLGFQVATYRGVTIVGHGGSLTGNTSDLRILPQQRIGWYVVFNGLGRDFAAAKLRTNLTRAIVEKFIVPATPKLVASGQSSAADLAGLYMSSRRTASGFPSFANLFSTVSVQAGKDGSLILADEKRGDGSLRHWLPMGRDRFIDDETGLALVAARGPDGRVARIASSLISGNSVLERAPAWTAWVIPLTQLALAIIAISALAWPVRLAFRRLLKRSGPTSAASRIPAPVMCIALVAILGSAYAWSWFMVLAQGDYSATFIADPRRQAVHALTYLALLGTAALVANAAFAWRGPNRGLALRLGAALMAVAALWLTWVAAHYGMLSIGDSL